MGWWVLITGLGWWSAQGAGAGPLWQRPESVIMTVLQGGIPIPTDTQGYVSVRINESYALEFRCPVYASAVDVRVDGVEVMQGLVCEQRVRLERPQTIAKQFIVLAEGDPGLGLDGGRFNPNLGLIEATFRPIRPREVFPPVLRAVPSDQATRSNLEQAPPAGVAVGTGLGADSEQRFQTTTAWIPAPEIAPVRTLRVRLRGIPPETPMVIGDPVPPRL